MSLIGEWMRCHVDDPDGFTLAPWQEHLLERTRGRGGAEVMETRNPYDPGEPSVFRRYYLAEEPVMSGSPPIGWYAPVGDGGEAESEATSFHPDLRVDTTAAVEAMARLRDSFAAMAPAAAEAAARYGQFSQRWMLNLDATADEFVDAATAATSQPYFLDLIARIDDVTR